MYNTFVSLLLVSTILPQFTFAISGGHTVQSSQQYPFSVTLTNPILCGGSIISLNPPWILTAAHCVENFDINEEDSSVAYGSRNFSRQSYARIKQVVSHPMYLSAAQLKSQVYMMEGAEIAPYDIALIELTEPLTPSAYVNRIQLSESSDSSDTNVILKNDNTIETIGMGYTGLGEPHADLLQYAVCNLTNITPLRNNNFNNSVILSISDAQLCHGDSGNPLVYHKKSEIIEEYYLAGILNRIANAYDPDPENVSCPVRESIATGFTNIFVRPSSHMNWITNVTGLSQSALTAAVLSTNNSNFVSSSSLSSATSSFVHTGNYRNAEWLISISVTISSLLSLLYL